MAKFAEEWSKFMATQSAPGQDLQLEGPVADDAPGQPGAGDAPGNAGLPGGGGSSDT